MSTLRNPQIQLPVTGLSYKNANTSSDKIGLLTLKWRSWKRT